jgi:hypothetical protein
MSLTSLFVSQSQLIDDSQPSPSPSQTPPMTKSPAAPAAANDNSSTRSKRRSAAAALAQIFSQRLQAQEERRAEEAENGSPALRSSGRKRSLHASSE